MRAQRRFLFIYDLREESGGQIFLPRNPIDWVERMAARVRDTWEISMAVSTLAHGLGGCSIAFLSRGSCLELDEGTGFGFIVSLKTLAQMRLFLGDGRIEWKQSLIQIEANLGIPNQRQEDGEEWEKARDSRIFLPSNPEEWMIAMRASITLQGSILMVVENRSDGRCIICFIPQLQDTEDIETALRAGKGFGFIAEPDTVHDMLDLLGLAAAYYKD